MPSCMPLSSFAEDTNLNVYTQEGREDRPYWFIAGQGGAWLGAFTLPIWDHLLNSNAHPLGQHRKPDAVLGTSVSALHAGLAAQGEIEKAYPLWRSMDDATSWNGIKGFTALAFKEGIWSTQPLRKKINALIDPKKIKIQAHVGVCSKNPFRHYTLSNSQAKTEDQWRDWIHASTAIATFFPPVRTQIDGQDIEAFDGGHLMSVPWIPYDMRAGDRLDILLHNPLDIANTTRIGTTRKNKLIDNMMWAFWVHTKTGHWEILSRVQKLVRKGVEVYLWAPDEELGDMLDATNEGIERRIQKGLDKIKKGPTRVF